MEFIMICLLGLISIYLLIKLTRFLAIEKRKFVKYFVPFSLCVLYFCFKKIMMINIVFMNTDVDFFFLFLLYAIVSTFAFCINFDFIMVDKKAENRKSDFNSNETIIIIVVVLIIFILFSFLIGR